MKRDKRRSRAGFTLIEIIAVLAIMSVLAAIATPSLLDFLESGRQTNRTNIARTVYLGAQNRLTELKITKNLKAFAANSSVGGYYERNDTTGEYDEVATKLENYNNVFKKLGESNLPDEAVSEKDYVHYISKASGVTAPSNPVIELLDPVILDKTIFDGAILIEFNVRTGAVLSVFYRDNLANGVSFDYLNDDSNLDIYGGRVYTRAYDRGQGYYGVGDTGDGTAVDDIEPTIINIYDSYTRKLPDNNTNNVLYADILVPKSQLAGNTFTLLINGEKAETGVNLNSLLPSDNLSGGLSRAKNALYPEDFIIYRVDNGTSETARIIWVLDYVGGNMLDSADNWQYTIGQKYDNKPLPDSRTLSVPTSANIRVGIQGGAVSATSVTEAHPYYFTENSSAYNGGNFTIKSARHLYNIRYKQDGSFTQRAEIDLDNVGISNFQPIPSLDGTYIGTGQVIKNLTVSLPSTTGDVGLFGVVSGGLSGRAYVVGLTLENPDISGGSNTGSVCGTLKGAITGAYVRYTGDTFGTSTAVIKGNGNVGGIAGLNDGGMLADSTFISPTPGIHISTVSDIESNTTGGIVGKNENGGILRRLMFLALAPKYNGKLNPIAGEYFSGAPSTGELYYLSGNAVRPDIIPVDGTAYNIGATNTGIGVGYDTAGLYGINIGTGTSAWTKNTLDAVAVVSTANTHYPYLYPSKFSQNQTAKDRNWPIVSDIGGAVGNVAYYEEYEDSPYYGFWSYHGLNTLRNDSKITEAGYIMLSDDDLSGTFLFAKNAGTAGSWSASNQIPATPTSTSLTFSSSTAIAQAVSSQTGNPVWVCVMPLDGLSSKSTQSKPLQLMYSTFNSGVAPNELGYIQPLFAKGLYPNPYQNLTNQERFEFIIRTPWQMMNISKLTGSTDYTAGNTFTQERELDFKHTGIGVGAGALPLNTAAVDDEFRGVYDGASLTIMNFEAQAPTGTQDIGLFMLNYGTIKDLALSSAKLTGLKKCGGIASQNFGNIIGSSVENLTFTGTQEDIGGITGINGIGGNIEDCRVSNTTINNGDNTNRLGGVAGQNLGNIIRTQVDTLALNGGEKIGGIAGVNTGNIGYCLVSNADISGKSNHIGGIAGESSNSVTYSGVRYSTVKHIHNANTDGNNTVGGIVGYNSVSSATVRDVFFLSVEDITAIDKTADAPVSDNGGGIVGQNSGTVERALYLAPAPKNKKSGVDNEYILYPIVRYDNAAEKNGNNETCFYLSGSRYSLNEGRSWIDKPYNRPDTDSDIKITVGGGGSGQKYAFIEKEWLNHTYKSEFDENWYWPTSGYPYPVITGMPVPDKWPEADSPVRPNQIDREVWDTVLPTSDRALNLGFINGDFADMYAAGAVADDPGEDRRHYVDMDAINGWRTRPVSQNSYNNNEYFSGVQSWRLIELQEPVNVTSISTHNEYMYTNYQGNYNRPTTNILNSQYRYAELNAAVQGTLYQLCPTTPGAQFYYSFYHSTRLANTAPSINGVSTDMMSFYLTGVSDNAQYANDSDLVLIRPCWSPRSVGENTTDPNVANRKYNPAAKNTVAYGTYNNNTYTQTPVRFYDSNEGKFITAYLYDVWVSGLGYGITFWSNTRFGVGAGGIPKTGVANISDMPADATNNIIGYWSESNGWKHYYGLYTVPKDQKRTEFAYQSNTPSPTSGNYLDGITFKSPAFLSVDKYVKMSNDNIRYYDVKYIKPGDTVTVALNIKSWGEIPAENITVKDQLAPYTEYIKYDGGATVTMGSVNITAGSTITYTNGTVQIKLPDTVKLSKDDEVKITFKVTALLHVASNPDVDTLLYYFKNQAVVEYNEDKTTTKFDAYHDIYSKKPKKNGSGPDPVQVFIDPIELVKTVRTVGYPGGGVSDPLVDVDLVGGVIGESKEFLVELTVQNTLDGGNSITTKGIINDLVPKDFEITNRGNLPDGPDGRPPFTANADGSTRITIRDVNLSNTTPDINYFYSIKYTGKGYGTAYTNASADYKYLYESSDTIEPLNVMLAFAKPVIGIRIKTQPDPSFTVDRIETASDGSTKPHIFEITKNDNFIEKLTDDNYDVIPEIILCDKDGNPAGKNGTGDYYIEYKDGSGVTKYTAYLPKGLNDTLRFVPAANSDGEYKLYYKINLVATRSDATPERFDLSSGVTEVTVNVTGTGGSP